MKKFNSHHKFTHLKNNYEKYQKFIKICISFLYSFGSNMNQDED